VARDRLTVRNQAKRCSTLDHPRYMHPFSELGPSISDLLLALGEITSSLTKQLTRSGFHCSKV
jgi:hypothetical protein